MAETTGSLSRLADELLRHGLPSLSVLRAQLAGVEGYNDFRRLVELFLPEREHEILIQNTPWEQMAAFASYFEDRYFPLDVYFAPGEMENYEDLTHRIPVQVYGLSWDDYESINYDARLGYQLITYLLENPYDSESDNVSLAEALKDEVPQELLSRVPERKLSYTEAKELFKGTKYEAIVWWAGRIECNTGNFLADTDYEMIYGGMPQEWDEDEVNALKEDWLRFQQKEDQLGKFVEWLEADTAKNFEEVLNFILEHRNDQKTPS